MREDGGLAEAVFMAVAFYSAGEQKENPRPWERANRVSCSLFLLENLRLEVAATARRPSMIPLLGGRKGSPPHVLPLDPRPSLQT